MHLREINTIARNATLSKMYLLRLSLRVKSVKERGNLRLKRKFFPFTVGLSFEESQLTLKPRKSPKSSLFGKITKNVSSGSIALEHAIVNFRERQLLGNIRAKT